MLKRLLALFLILSLTVSLAGAEAPAQMEIADALSFARSFFERSEIAGQAPAMTLNRDDDCWVCEAAPSEGKDKGFLLIFDDSGRVHRYQNLQYALPEIPAAANSWRTGTEGLLTGDALDEISTAVDRLLMDTRGWGYNVTGVSADIGDGLYLLTLDDFLSYALVSYTPDSCVIAAYGDLETSHGAYDSGLTRNQAIAIARLTAEAKYGLTATDIAVGQADFEVSDPERYFVDGPMPLPYWFVVLLDSPDQETAGEYCFLIDAATGEALYSTDPENGASG
ncbi:MAG: hypothetical protein IKP40_10315 [Clostridia bacterium]|nr:hypothetical protein [Clostridia bacterium]